VPIIVLVSQKCVETCLFTVNTSSQSGRTRRSNVLRDSFVRQKMHVETGA